MKELIKKMQDEANSKAFISNQVVFAWIDEATQMLENKEVKKIEKNGIEYCSNCGQKVSKKRRRIEKAMITGLLKAIHYCRKTKQRTFKKRDVKTLNPVEYTLITFLPKFGLLYKNDSMQPGEFGIPFKICKEFFNGERSVLEYYEIDPTKQEGEDGYKINSESRVYFKDIPKHSELIDSFPHTIQYLQNNNF